MKSRPVANPPVRFREHLVTYDEGDGPPPAKVTLLDDQSRSILSENDSPDVGFRWSANPYRGCQHACAYCMDGRTPILLADGRTRPMIDLKVGDEILGTRVDGKHRYYTRTRVLDHWSTLKLAFEVTLADGTTLVASGDHRFLTERGWKHVMPAIGTQRPFLTLNNSMVGPGAFAATPAETDDYKRGFLCGFNTDGCADLEALARAKRYLAAIDIETHELDFAIAEGYRPMRAIRTHARSHFEQISELVRWPESPSAEWQRGLLAGAFDAEGSRSQHVLRIANTDDAFIAHTMAAMRAHGFDATVETRPRGDRALHNVRLRGGLKEHLRFFHTTAPAISRKWDLDGTAIRTFADLRVVNVERLGLRKLYDITTGTGDFIANGVVSHNCYARPTHEYLDLGAGTDFDTKIVVKRNAPELLRETFDKPSWKGELVMFSGVTDCYQAVEKELELTRRMLEVCVEYKNPVAVISKSALVERDMDLFQQLAKDARFFLNVSLAFTDNEQSRAIEPWAASPDRRFKVIEAMAKAGVPVGVMIAPVIPGVNDSQMVTLLERARDAGATQAGWVLLRLPGAVKQVFEERLRIAMPLAADKVLHRIRSTRGGEKLYDSRFGTRGRGEGPYAAALATMFDSTVKRLGLNSRICEEERAAQEPTTFQRPAKGGQLSLF